MYNHPPEGGVKLNEMEQLKPYNVGTKPTPYDAPVKFLIRQMNGIMRGELTLDEETSRLYRSSTHDGQIDIRLELCVSASEHFKTDCYVSEVLNRR